MRYGRREDMDSMKTSEHSIAELRIMACSLEREIIDRAWKALESGSSPDAFESLHRLMMLCSDVNGWGCRACESPPRAWRLLWALLRIDIEPDAWGAENNPYEEVLASERSLPEVRHILEWALGFQGAIDEPITWTCPDCGQAIVLASAIPSTEVELHREKHRDRIRGAVLGMVAGDQAGIIVGLLLEMANARSTPSSDDFLELERGYQHWVQDLEFFAEHSGLDRSSNSSVGACVACVLALDPALKELTSLAKLASQLSEALGCNRQAVSASVVCAVSCRRAIGQIAGDLSASELELMADGLLIGEAAITMAAGGPAPEGVVRLPRRPQEIRTGAMTETHDDARAVLLAARHFQDISMHVHTTLSRIFSWGGEAHPAGIIAGFQAGARYGATAIKPELMEGIELRLRAEINRTAEELVTLWVPVAQDGS